MADFRFLKQFNDPENHWVVDRRRMLSPQDMRAFPGEGAVDKFARVLCAHRTTTFRELIEAFEFFGLVRKHVRAEVVADLCGGHGLVAALFAVFERRVDRVVVLDRKRPPSFDRVVAAAAEYAPWTAGRIDYVEAQLRAAQEQIPQDASLVAVHACGKRSDVVLELALARRAPLALMPCCHPVALSPAPEAIKRELGAVAVDIHRTYTLENQGFHVRWSQISERITRMNRVLLARPRAAHSA